jgi:hypothetical protein
MIHDERSRMKLEAVEMIMAPKWVAVLMDPSSKELEKSFGET